MKTDATRIFHGGLALCLCLVFASITARCQPTFGGITANSGVNFNGNNVEMDSFNSADTNHSIWQPFLTYHGMPYGVYSDSLSYSSNSLPSRTSDFTLATDGSIINVGNANIYGFVDTAPGGNVAITQYGSVGDLNWVYGGTSGVEPGHEQDNMNQIFYSKSLPNPAANIWQTTWLPVPASLPKNAYFKIGGTWINITGIGWTNVGGTQYQASSSGTVSLPTPGANGQVVTYSMVITNLVANTNWVYYSIGQLSGNIFVDAPNVVLYCTNGISYSGYSTFTLNTNADVTIYTTGSISTSGNAVINNGPNYARALSIYDVAGYTDLAFSFGGKGITNAFIYAPSSSVVFSGGGSQSYSFVGAIFCNNISFNGHYSVHYDESLDSESIPPWISQPANQYVQAGSNATFSVEAGGSPLTYQWYFQVGLSNAIYGATNSSLTITNAQPANWGRYSVVVSNPYGSVASSQAWLLVYSNAAAALSGAFIATNGQFQLTVSNADNLGGMPYTIQASTNLTDWAPIYSNTSPFSYLETNAFPQRYYRAVFAP
jgi:hypothetical protein